MDGEDSRGVPRGHGSTVHTLSIGSPATSWNVRAAGAGPAAGAPREGPEPMNHVERDPIPAGRCNGAVAVPLDEARGQAMIAAKAGERFDVRLVDRRNDHDARDAPGRVARMTVRELLRGRFPGPPGIAGFENAGGVDHLTVTGPTAVRPTCAHHLKPIGGGACAGHANRMVGPECRGGMLVRTAPGDGFLRGCHALGRRDR
jgi:hypothetical protein